MQASWQPAPVRWQARLSVLAVVASTTGVAAGSSCGARMSAPGSPWSSPNRTELLTPAAAIGAAGGRVEFGEVFVLAILLAAHDREGGAASDSNGEYGGGDQRAFADALAIAADGRIDAAALTRGAAGLFEVAGGQALAAFVGRQVSNEGFGRRNGRAEEFVVGFEQVFDALCGLATRWLRGDGGVVEQVSVARIGGAVERRGLDADNVDGLRKCPGAVNGGKHRVGNWMRRACLGLIVENDEIVRQDRNIARDFRFGRTAACVFHPFQTARERRDRVLYGFSAAVVCSVASVRPALDFGEHVGEARLVRAAAVDEARLEGALRVLRLRLQAFDGAGDLFADLADGFGAAAFAFAHALVEAVGEAVDFGVVERAGFKRRFVDAVVEALDAFVVTTCGEANLGGLEPELRVELKMESRGHVWVRVEITPDHLAQEHMFQFEVDQSYLKRLIEDCRKVLATYPVRGKPELSGEA